MSRSSASAMALIGHLDRLDLGMRFEGVRKIELEVVLNALGLGIGRRRAGRQADVAAIGRDRLLPGILGRQLRDDVERVFLQRIAAHDGIPVRTGLIHGRLARRCLIGARAEIIVGARGRIAGCPDGSTRQCIGVGRRRVGRAQFGGNLFERRVEIDRLRQLVFVRCVGFFGLIGAGVELFLLGIRLIFRRCLGREGVLELPVEIVVDVYRILRRVERDRLGRRVNRLLECRFVALDAGS